jgi:hypothetical protein
MSHTTKVQIEFLNLSALRSAVESMGGEWLGEMEVRLYSSREFGTAFKLSGWKFPCCITADGLKFDNYNGAWGDIRTLDTLKAEYALSVAQSAAEAQGWYTERVNDEVVIHHPDGGVIRVNAAGAVDATQFTGSSCALATAPIEAALGFDSQRTLKAEFYNQTAQVKVRGE